MTRGAADDGRRADDAAGAGAGTTLLIASSAVLLVVNAWHSLIGGNGLSGKALAELMVASAVWAPMHLIGSFGYALLAAAAVALMCAPGALGRGALARAGLALVAVGAAAGTVGFVFDGQRAFIAPDVIRGENVPIFVALTYLWDDRGIGVPTYVLIGAGAAILAASQLGAPTVSPKWATLIGIVGSIVIAISFLITFGLRIFPGGGSSGVTPVGQLVGLLGFSTLFGWLILAGALAQRPRNVLT